MSCLACEGIGVVPYVLESNPKPDAAIGVEDLFYALCRCPRGLELRDGWNGAGKPSPFGLWQLWAAQHGIDPARVGRVEDVFSQAELAAVGLSETRTLAGAEDIAAAMRTRRPKL